MTRLVKTVTEMEGRFEERWVLVEDDETEPWPANPELRHVGKPAPRITGEQRVTGSARYTVDVQPPGMLHALVVRSPIAHGKVVALDLDAARGLDGVRLVLGPDSPVGYRVRAPYLSAEPQWAGGAIAIVVADSEAQAAAGAAALGLELQPLPHDVDLEQGLQAQRFTEDPEEESRGDVDRALAEADVRIEFAFATPGHLQTALEPHAAVGWWQVDGVTAWVSTQGMYDAREELAKRYRLEKDQVRIICEFIGGGFGAKQGAGNEAVLAVECSRQTGRPVRLVNDRHAEQLIGGHRAQTRQSVRLGATRDGRLTAMDADCVAAMGQGGWVSPFTTPAMTLYRVENARAMTFPVKLNLRPVNAFRAPGVVEGTTVFEQAVDVLAEALGIDPLELRRINAVDVDQGSGLPYTSKHLLACYDRAAELAGWAGRAALREPQSDGLLRGMGCASQIWWGGGGPPAQATIRLGADGIATVVTGIQDIGTGSYTAAQIVAAEELGLPLAKVRVVGGDTRPNVYGPVSGGSMTTPSVVPAVRSAASIVRTKLLQLAGDVFEVDPGDLELVDGRIKSVDGALDEALEQVTGKLGDATVDGSGARGPNPDGYRTNTFGCQIAQIAVDAALGEVRVERIVAVHDVGRIINPLGASSQVEGGILQGMAYALTEERVLDPTTGIPTNAHLDDYKLPTIADSPELVVDFIDRSDDLLSNVGSKGLGEPPIIPTAAAIANAFAHATGRRAAAIPLTRARVFEALR